MALGLGKYLALSTVAASAVIYHAFATRQHFFPATVYLSSSKIAVATMGNLAFATALCIQKAVIKIFLGSLRDIEQEMIRERLSSAVMESLLALTIFREEFSAFFVSMFATLVFIKVLHWLVQDRVDYVEVTPAVSMLQHVRIASFMVVLLAVDLLFLQYTVHGTIQSSGQSVMLLFAFEYVIQVSNISRYCLKYAMSMWDLYLEGRWESKGTYMFYLELITDLLHLFVYCIFFIIVFTNYGLPLHLVRDLYSTFRNFRNRIVDFLRFRQVTARLDRFPDATAADLQRSDGVCIICREEMAAARGLNKKLYCGHVFHVHCLRSWLERQQNCPTCRASVFHRRAEQEQAAPAAAAADAGRPNAQALGAAAQQAAQPDAANGLQQQANQPQAAPPPNPAQLRQELLGEQQPGQQHQHQQHPRGIRMPRMHQVQVQVAANRGASQHAAAPPPQQQQPRQQQQQQQEQEHEAAAGPSSSASTSAAAAATAGAEAGQSGAARAAVPSGFMWQVPQWYPITSMAAFPAAQLQYAGQQTAAEAIELMPPVVPYMPFIPALSAAFPPMMPPPMAPQGVTVEQQAAAAATAAAMTAAAAIYNPMAGLIMMPPAMPILQPAAGAAPQPIPIPPEQLAAAAAAGRVASPAMVDMQYGVLQASMEATQQLLERQMEYVQAQIDRLKQTTAISATDSGAGAGAAAGAAAGAGGDASTPDTAAGEASTSTSTAAPSPGRAAVPNSLSLRREPAAPAGSSAADKGAGASGGTLDAAASDASTSTAAPPPPRAAVPNSFSLRMPRVPQPEPAKAPQNWPAPAAPAATPPGAELSFSSLPDTSSPASSASSSRVASPRQEAAAAGASAEASPLPSSSFSMSPPGTTCFPNRGAEYYRQLALESSRRTAMLRQELGIAPAPAATAVVAAPAAAADAPDEDEHAELRRRRLEHFAALARQGQSP